MAVSYFYNEIARGFIQNLDTGDILRFMLNPEQFRTSISVNYKQTATIGGSHQWLQFTHTSNATFSVDLMFSRFILLAERRQGTGVQRTDFDALAEEFEDARRFLMELCYPRGRANDPLRRSPPPCLLMWPRHVAMVVVIRSVQFNDTRFDQQQRVVEFKATCQFEEYRQYRLTSTQARQKGLVRARPI